jgi:hypothetical protein
MLLLSVEYALGKKLILFGFVSIYLLLVLRGLFKIIFSSIFSLFIYFFDIKEFERIYWFLNDYKKILYFIASIFIQFFEKIFFWVIIDKFSPNYTPLAIVFRMLSNFIIEIIIKKKIDESNLLGWDLYIRIFLYLILIIGILLHNQIIVINICGLGFDTKYFLDLKVENESLYSISEDVEVLKRFETLDELEDKNNNNIGSIENRGLAPIND